MARLSRRSGSEGPRHDPYGFVEWTFTRTDGMVVVLHDGLAEWCKVDGNKPPVESPHEAFEIYTGLSVADLEDAWQRIQHTCKKCGHHGTYESDGFPGETINICENCGSIVSVDFNEGAII